MLTFWERTAVGRIGRPMLTHLHPAGCQEAHAGAHAEARALRGPGLSPMEARLGVALAAAGCALWGGVDVLACGELAVAVGARALAVGL